MESAEDTVGRIDQIDSRLVEVADRMREIDAEHSDSLISGDAADEWNSLGAEKEKLEELRGQMEARRKVIESLGRTAEKAQDFSFNAPRSTEDIFDVSKIRGQHNTEEGERAAYADHAKRAIERASFPNPYVREDDAKARLTRLVEGSEDSVTAKRILLTGSPLYARAFQAQMMQWVDHPKARPLTADEERVLKRAGSTGTGGSGGYAVPFTLDPTLIHTSNLSVNPWRAVCRTVTITTNTWKAVTSGSVTATRQAEGGTATDNMSTLTQPSGVPTRVQSFVPFSVEIEGDWPEMQSEIALLIAEAKDDEETASLYNGSGTAPAIVGLLGANGLTTSQRQQTAGTAAFAIGDVYALQAALPPRIRGREAYLGSNFAWNKVRQFDTAGGAGLFAPTLQSGLGTGHDNARLNIPMLGRPAYELSSLGTTLGSATKLMVAGDFSRFVIVDRVGMNVELIPMIQSGGLPTGQRGIYAWWRNCSVLTDANAFRYLEVL